MKPLYLSIIIPAHNEEKNIARGVLDEVNGYLAKQSFTWEVLLVDDASTDDSLRLMKDYTKNHPKFRVLAEPHRGKGGTVIAGILSSRGKVVLFTDTDQSTPIYELDKIFPLLNQNYDVVIGSRSGRKGAPIIRKLMAYGFSLLRTVVLRLPYKDTQCGFKAFKREAAMKIFKKMKVYNEKVISGGAAVTAGFDLEVLYLARKMHLRVAEVSVDWRHQETERINPLRDSWEGLRDLFKVRINALIGRYR